MAWTAYASNSWVQSGSPSDPEVWAFAATRMASTGALVVQVFDASKPVGVRIYGSPLLDTCYEAIFTAGTGGNVIIRKWTHGTAGAALDTAAHGLADGDNYTMEVRWLSGHIYVYLNGSTTAAVDYDTSNDLAHLTCMGFASEEDGARVGSAKTYALTQTFAALADVAWWVAGGILYASDSGRDGARTIGPFFDPNATVVGAEDLQHAIIVDGTHAVDFDAVAMTAEPFELDAGKMPGQSALNTPLGNTTAKVIVAYNSRVGFLQDQYAIFSALGDRADLDLTAITEGKAFVWPSQVGEPLVGAYVAAKNRLIMWGRRSMWELTGDPVLGADVTRISAKTGGSGPYAAAMVDLGAIVVHGDQGLQIIGPGGNPQPLSEMVLTDLLQTTAAADTLHVTVVQDTKSYGLWVFLTPADGSQGTHLWYDERTGQYSPTAGGFWPVRFATAGTQPTCAMRYQGEVVFGTMDGRMMFFDEAAAGEDGGSDYESRIAVLTARPSRLDRSVMIYQMGLVMGLDSDPVDITLWGGDTPERAYGANRWQLWTTENAADRDIFYPSVTAPAIVAEIACTGGQFSLEACEIAYKLEPLIRQPRRNAITPGPICQPPAPEPPADEDDTDEGPGPGTDDGETCVPCETWMAENFTDTILGQPAFKLGGPVGVGGTTEDAVAEADAAIDALIAELVCEALEKSKVVLIVVDIDDPAQGPFYGTITNLSDAITGASPSTNGWNVYFRCIDNA